METIYYYYFIMSSGYPKYPKSIYRTQIHINTAINRIYKELTQEQLVFYQEHPLASVQEVWDCKLNPPYVPPELTLEELREQSLDQLDRASRETLSTFVDTLAFANAVATSLYAKAKGITPIYDDSEILSTATNFLEKGSLCRNKTNSAKNIIENAETKKIIYQTLNEALAYFTNLKKDTDNIEKHRSAKLQAIDVYDNSDAVNGFYYNGQFMWLDKSTRVGLVNTLDSAEEMGRETINIWYNNQVCIELDVQTARLILSAIELYATDCYNITASHKRTIMNMDNIEDIDNFDITTGYPPMLHFGESE